MSRDAKSHGYRARSFEQWSFSHDRCTGNSGSPNTPSGVVSIRVRADLQPAANGYKTDE